MPLCLIGLQLSVVWQNQLQSLLHGSKKPEKGHAAPFMSLEHGLNGCSDAADTVTHALLVTFLYVQLPTASQHDSIGHMTQCSMPSTSLG